MWLVDLKFKKGFMTLEKISSPHCLGEKSYWTRESKVKICIKKIVCSHSWPKSACFLSFRATWSSSLFRNRISSYLIDFSFVTFASYNCNVKESYKNVMKLKLVIFGTISKYVICQCIKIRILLHNLFQSIVEAATGASAIHRHTLCGLYPRTYLTLK